MDAQDYKEYLEQGKGALLGSGVIGMAVWIFTFVRRILKSVVNTKESDEVTRQKLNEASQQRIDELLKQIKSLEDEKAAYRKQHDTECETLRAQLKTRDNEYEFMLAQVKQLKRDANVDGGQMIEDVKALTKKNQELEIDNAVTKKELHLLKKQFITAQTQANKDFDTDTISSD
jgi:vacuolar-type H+-ATPase subunit I/STV1